MLFLHMVSFYHIYLQIYVVYFTLWAYNIKSEVTLESCNSDSDSLQSFIVGLNFYGVRMPDLEATLDRA